MKLVTVIVVVAIAVVLGILVMLIFAQVWNKKRKSLKHDTTRDETETEKFIGTEMEISDVLPQEIQLSTVQPHYQDIKDEDEDHRREKSLHGYLYFTVKYNEDRSILIVKLIKGENIPVQESYPSKPYVEIRVIPVNAKPTHGPEGIEFNIVSEELYRQTVHFSICRYNNFSRKTIIGDVFLSLAELSADQVDLHNEIFLKNMIEPNIKLKVRPNRSAKELWEKLRNAIRSRGFVRKLKRRSFVEPVEWESSIIALETKGELSPTDVSGEGASKPLMAQKKSVKENGPLGKLFFSLKFDEKRCVLLIKIMKAIDIPDDNGRPPCVMVEGALLSGAQTVEEPFTTTVQENTFAPVFEEVFEFKVDLDDLWKKKIRFLIWYLDSESHLTNLGEVVYSLSNHDIEGFNISEAAMLFSEDITLLHKTKDFTDESSRILFSLTYLPATKRLVVLIHKIKDLKATQDCRGVYVEASVLHQNLRYRKATGFKTETCNPVFNEALLFDLKDVVIDKVKLHITIFQKNTMGSTIPLAKCNLGKETGGSEEAHWIEALTVSKPTAQWHKLQPIKYVKPLVQGVPTMTTKALRPSFDLPKPRR